jgi:hypothetical protein
VNILQAIADPNLFGPFFGKDLKSWRAWGVALKALYGLPVTGTGGIKLIKDCMGRDAAKLPRSGFDQALFLTGRRSGKSRTAAAIGAFEAVLAGHEKKLAKGERGVVPIISPSRSQSRIVKDYLRNIFETPLLREQLVRETATSFELVNGTRVEILAGDYKTVRGFTLLSAIVDEVAFMGVDAESKVRSDTELIRALLPGLATTGGTLVAISSPHARKGWVWRQYQRCFGNDEAKTLVWNAASRTMNPTLPQRVVDQALADDLQAAKSEYLGEFRDDVSSYLPQEVIEALVVPGRRELQPDRHHIYRAFADVSGGRGDDATLAIAHQENGVVVIDKLCRYRPPFNPHLVIRQMVDEVRRWGIINVTGDNYAAEFVSTTFGTYGTGYQRCEKNKNQLYAELLPKICSREIELLDEPALVQQLASLERRVRAGGRDIIDHPPGGHDDLANVVAGATSLTAGRQIVCGAL